MSAEDPSVTLFREYLRIKTVQPTPDYAGAAAFLKNAAEKKGLKFATHECVAGKPIVILTWEGSEPDLPSILLNSHIDVVPVEESKWNTDPFGAHKDENGNIYARGSQDMKCVGIQHLEAVSRLKEGGYVPKRTVHISFVPDEEIGGKDGMEKFVKTEAFAALKVGFALDEGLANPGEECMTYYGERSAWWVVAEATGPTGHGSQLFQDTAVDRLLNFLQPYYQWRKEESMKLHGEGSTLALGDVTTININMIKAGAFSEDGQSWQTNIIPSTAKCAIDMRVAPTVDLVKFEADLLARAAQFNVQVTILQCMRSNPTTSTDASASPWWHTFLTVCQAQQIKPKLAIFPAATDSRFLRANGIPAIGFSPMNHTPVLLHDHNEFLNEKTFLKGIDFFVQLVQELSGLPRHGLDQ